MQAVLLPKGPSETSLVKWNNILFPIHYCSVLPFFLNILFVANGKPGQNYFLIS
jgi:hypothetical protein